jgi:predicted nucleic acid-binding protein
VILVDTSVWIDHLRSHDAMLAALLEQQDLLIHPMIIGELALGSIANRATVLGLLGNLPHVFRASDDEILTFIEARSLVAKGLSLVDVHLLASTTLTPGTKLWTRDKQLNTMAQELGLAWRPNLPIT